MTLGQTNTTKISHQYCTISILF